MKNKIYLLLTLLLATGCAKDFLDKGPKTSLLDKTYWTSEANIRTFAYGFYNSRLAGPATMWFKGHGNGWQRGDLFGGRSQQTNDNFATSGKFQTTVPSTDGNNWNFKAVRKANLMIDRVQNVATNIDDETRAHWVAIGKFFRAMAYSDLTRNFGDVPFYSQVIEDENDNVMLYKPRDPRVNVADSMLKDLREAVASMRAKDGEDGVTVNKYVAAGFAARIMIFEACVQKYHPANFGGGNMAKAAEYFQAAKEFCEVVMSGPYSIAPSYAELFNSASLAGNPEIIMYRAYEDGVVRHCTMSYVNKEGQTGTTKDLWDSYLCSDGLPISLSSQFPANAYKADPSNHYHIPMFDNRDKRMTETLVDTLRLSGVSVGAGTTGIAVRKYLNEEMRTTSLALSVNNISDAPIMRLGEVVVTYAEACAELADLGKYTLTQDDLDKSINLLRKRAGLPKLQVVGGQPAVNGRVYDDPKRDPSVPSMIWEIRRERRVEMTFEAQRLNDLIRWRKLEYTDMNKNKDINTGIWVDKTWFLNKDGKTRVSSTLWEGKDAMQGWIKPIISDAAIADRAFDETNLKQARVYLRAIPSTEVNLYQSKGYELTQNPGWDLK